MIKPKSGVELKSLGKQPFLCSGCICDDCVHLYIDCPKYKDISQCGDCDEDTRVVECDSYDIRRAED